MGEWREYKISDIADVIGGGTPKTSVEEYWNGDIPWIAPRDLTGYNKVYISNGDRFITKDGLKNSSTKLIPKGSVLLTSRAPIGYVAIAQNEICTNQGFKSLVPKKDLCNSEFLYYWIKNNVNYLQQLGTGTTFAEISGSVVKSIDILLPPLKEQKAIAGVLSSLDDKIDLLHRQNKTLEELAQTLFRQWFIEEANDKWEEIIGNTSIQIIDGDRGKNYPKSTEFFSPEHCLFLNAKNVTKNGFNFGECNFITKEKDEILRNGKLERNDIVLTTRGTVGNLALYDKLIEYNHIRINSGMVIFRSKNISSIYLYIFLKSQYFTDSVIEQTSGSAQPQLPIRDIKNIKIIIPPKDILEDFLLKVNPLYKKLNSNQQQIKTLENIRDTLLPKLMSGEVKIKLEKEK